MNKNIIDLENLPNLFGLSDCHHFAYDEKEMESLSLKKVAEINSTCKAFFYTNMDDILITFSAFDFISTKDFITTAVKLYTQYSLVNKNKENNISISKFFNDHSLFFIELLREYLEKIDTKRTKNIYLSGISMGGAMAQAFCYNLYQLYPHLKKINMNVFAFGSPRVGNANFGKWFAKNRVNVKNFVLCKDGEYDPVVMYPGKDDKNYVFNPNLHVIYPKEEKEKNKKADLKHLNKQNIYNFGVCDFLFNQKLTKNWESIHDISEYSDAL